MNRIRDAVKGKIAVVGAGTMGCGIAQALTLTGYLTTLVDVNSDEGWSLARSYRDAPAVDNFIRIDTKLPIGEFVDVKITEAFEYDVKGECLTHEPEAI